MEVGNRVKYTGRGTKKLIGAFGTVVAVMDGVTDCEVVFDGNPSNSARLNKSNTVYRHNVTVQVDEPAPVLKETADPMKAQVGGSHYKGMAIQPMEYSMANGFDALQHTIIKYVSRFRNKNGIEDLRKARHAIDMLIAHEEKTHAV